MTATALTTVPTDPTDPAPFPPSPPHERTADQLAVERREATVRLRGDLAAALRVLGRPGTRDVTLGWLASAGLLRRLDTGGGPDAETREAAALDRAANLAHRAAGHPGPLSMCTELCRLLAEADAY